MLDTVLSVIAPHYCTSCDEIGEILCNYCKYDIISEKIEYCMVCRVPCSSHEALCRSHPLHYTRAWCVGERTESLRELLDLYKFERVKSSSHILAELLDHSLPLFSENITVVPVPTIARHIRQRGYDHTALIAQELAKRRSLPYLTAIERTESSSQLGKSKRERRLQAQRAFKAKQLPKGIYLLVDDIFTTGSTIEFAAKALRDAGASDVWVAVIARQPLEK